MYLGRREFLAGSLAGLAASAAADPPMRIATSGFIWQNEIEDGIRTTARFGFHGIEPFRHHVAKYLDRPQELKKQLDDAGIAMASCSNGGNMSTDFIHAENARRTIEDHERFAGEFLVHFGCRHFKINMGRRPDEGPTADHLKLLSQNLNELGRRTAKLGVKLAPHPHIWSPLERGNELKRMLELTDPEYVFLVADTAHLTLGGTDPMEVIRGHYKRVAALHFKDTEPKYRGYRGATPTTEEHRKVNLYKNLGAGGVDFPGVVKFLWERKYAGWITLDLDPPRPGDGTIEDNLEINKKYVRDVLKLALRG